ncbi:FadR/GntR family transcriptional regulator [Oceanomicrobium pacificus]|uniref:FCD domain-containing protein n=1 Tax=Oceanomicrobium pacificus TaxID=2692916 RepID=A0A6B0TK90_9RHOB|nr:FCD domain-containing protein [Oceanomicrobium pacificus]MXU64877.1 FCD domain-containing protein [Oceanomicrobium pacificus]
MVEALSNTPSRTDRRGARLEERVYTGLLDDIRLGKFTLGQRLPSETELANQYGCSRPVIRSALAKLRESGLIVSRQGSGSYVSSGHPGSGSGYAALDSINDIAGYFRFRKLIESEAVALAAAHAGPEDIAALRRLVARMDKQADSGAATVESDIEFHELIANLSNSRFIVETVRMLRPHWLFIGKFVRSLGNSGYRSGKRDMSDEHLAVIDALEAGDAAAARKAMQAHIDGSERRVFKGE